MKPLDQKTQQFIEHLWRGGSWGYFWTLNRATSEKRTHWTLTEDVSTMPNGKTDVYFGVNPTNQQKDQYHRALISDVSAVNCLFAEFDGPDFDGKDAALDHVRSLRPLPSVVIDSGGGFHCYWLLRDTFIIEDDAQRAYIRDVLYRWVAFVGGDVVKDLARVLRVPGTHNYKSDYGPQPPPVNFVFVDMTHVFTLAELVQMLPLPEEPKKRTATTTVDIDDSELLRKIRDSKQAAKFVTLYDRGDFQGYKSNSEADAALCAILIGWTGGDTQRTDRLFRQSALFRPERWDSPRTDGTYGSITLDFALKKATWFYEPRNQITAPVFEEGPLDYLESPPEDDAGFFTVPEVETATTEVAGWRWLTMEDAYSERPPREYIIEKLLSRPSLTMPYGSPGGLKTMLVMDMAMSVLSGQPFLEALPGIEKVSPFDTTPTPVMWIDVDNGERRSLDRMKALGKARNIPEDAPFYFVSFPTPPFIARKEDSTDFIIENVIAGNVGLVVFDNLGSISGGADENSSEMVNVMSGLRRIAERGNCAVVVIHHRNKGNGVTTRKGNALRGHSSIEGALDLALLIQREEGEDAITIESTKTRDIPVWPFEAMWTYEQDASGELVSGRFWGLGRPETDAANRPAKDRAYEIIMIDIGASETLSQSAIVAKCKAAKIGRNAVLTALAQLERDHLMIAERGERNAKLYKLTGLGIEKQREIMYNA